MNEDAYVSDEEELECPLCMEEFDISDRTFKPCPCGYQICRFCYNRIVNSETANGCPACRRKYTEETVEFKPLSAEEWKKDQQRIQSRKLKEKEKRESEMASRRHLSNMRVVQKNLVYVIGFSPKSADADLAATLRGNDYFAQYGKINKIVVNKKSHPNGQPTVGVYITYARKEDAARAVQAVDNTINDGRVLRASFGTTKYCSAYLRQQICQNPNCMYLHEPGEDLDSYTREDMSTIQHAAKAAEGMHANALAAHHMRRQPTRTDSMGTTNQEAESSGAALPPTASWASLSKPNDNIVETTTQDDNKKPDSLPAPARGGKESRAEIPPPPSQGVQNAVQPSELLPAPVQPGINHSVLGSIMKSLAEGQFKFDAVPKVMPGLSEADLKSAETFPQLFAWNPQPRRPSSPSKASKNHARSGSRYAFAAESSKTPPPGFVPPGLATGLQPPGFTTGGITQVKDGPTDFFSQFLRNSNVQDNTADGHKQAGFEDPAILGLRESVKSPTDLVFNPQNDFEGAIPTGLTDHDFADELRAIDDIAPRYSPPLTMSIPLSATHATSLDYTRQASEAASLERPQTKSGASFAGLRHLENQAQEMAQDLDVEARGTWEPAPRPRDAMDKISSKAEDDTHLKASQAFAQHHLSIPKSSGTWQPSPPPVAQTSPSPKSSISNVQRFAPSYLRNANKAPWEPSPPLAQRGKSPAISTQEASPATFVAEDLSNTTVSQKSTILLQEDFPALSPARAIKSDAPATTNQAIAKKQWDSNAQASATPIATSSSRSDKANPRRDSLQSVISGAARSRQNSVTESLTSKVHTPSKIISPTTSPLSSRASSPVLTAVTPQLFRTTSSAAPAVSSPLANLNTGKQIRILSTKAADEAKIKAEKQAAEERAIAKMKEDDLAAASRVVRKSVPANSIKKSKEQKQAEQREKAERRERESVQSQASESAAPPTEIAPIIGRARKQKSKAPKTPVKTPMKNKPEVATPAAIHQEHDSEEEVESAWDENKKIAAEVIREVSKTTDLLSHSMFKPYEAPLERDWGITKEEIARAMELKQWPTFAGKESIEELEAQLARTRKEYDEAWKECQVLQRRNIRFVKAALRTVAA